MEIIVEFYHKEMKPQFITDSAIMFVIYKVLMINCDDGISLMKAIKMELKIKVGEIL